MKDALLTAFGLALDGVEVGYCAFNSSDHALAWNATFLEIFPEHDGKIWVGEPYAANLKRFYEGRLSADELPHIERYIAEGIARHRSQRRPYEFNHRNFRVRVSSVEIGRFGRVRVWRKVADLATVPAKHVPSTLALAQLNAIAVLERLVDGVLIVDIADKAMWANQAFLGLYGLRSVESAIGQSFESIYRSAWAGQEQHPGFSAGIFTLRESQLCSGAPFELALPGDRFVRVFEQRGEVDGRGYFEHMDITHPKRQQAALAEAEQRYRLLAEFSSDIILSVEGGAITYASPALTELLGWHVAEVLGKPIRGYCHPDDVMPIAELLHSIGGDRNQVEYRARAKHRDGSFVWVEARVRLLPSETGGLMARHILNLRGIAARKMVEDELMLAKQRLHALATTDPLTGLANRRKLDEVLPLEFRRSQREELPLSVLLVDIDRFKQLNDAHGHLVGDEVLKTLADLLLSFAQRAGDLAVRLGGDEFLVMLPGTDSPQAAALAKDLVRQVEQAQFAAPVGQATVSVGVATLVPSSGLHNLEELLSHTDKALYKAKREGRNRVVVAALG